MRGTRLAAREGREPLHLVAKAGKWTYEAVIMPVGNDSGERRDYVTDLRVAEDGGVITMSYDGDEETQAEIIDRLRKDDGLKPFFAAIDKVDGVREPSAYEQVDVEFGGLSQRDIDEVRAFGAKQTHPRYKLPEDFDLGNVRHATREANLWHAYAHHALDSFRKDYPDQISVTYDDLRMIPEIVEKRDQVYAEHKGGAWTLVYVKAYGDIEYRYVEKLGSRDDGGQRMARTTTEWLTKKRNAGGGTLTPTSKSSQKAHLFPRTAKILAVEEYVKQNFAEEASKIVETAIQKKNVLRAPNKKLSNLPPALWVVVRLQSFKAWFGDWEKDPEHASKVLDENGEPLVVYHGTPKGGFKEFKEESYFTPHREYAERYVHAGGKGNIWGVTDGEPSMYELFLNIRKPFDTRTKADAAIFEREFLGKWGNNTPLSERGLPDWTDAADLLEFLAERGGGYDGVIIDEGGDVGEDGSPVWRGVSYLTASPTQIKSATENRGTFDGGNPNITFSEMSADEVYSAWSARVQHFIQNPPPSGSSGFRRDMTVCPTPAVFRMLGLKQFDIAVAPAVLAKAIDADEVYGNGMRNADFYKDVDDVAKHGLRLEDLPKLPGQLADPVCVTVSDTPGCVEVVTEIMDRGDNVLVAVKIGTGTSNDVEANIHRIKSLYGKESIEKLLTHPVLYWNKAKARIWMKNGGLQLPTTPHLTAGFRGTILKPADLVKYKNPERLSISTSRSNSAYQPRMKLSLWMG